jgi:hypothetical protein
VLASRRIFPSDVNFYFCFYIRFAAAVQPFEWPLGGRPVRRTAGQRTVSAGRGGGAIASGSGQWIRPLQAAGKPSTGVEASHSTSEE